ncbi:MULTISPECIES: phage major capsid protein [unclassified Mycolicibacterium]|uniref:phage major capsid protein n=1 Tax=unclassified Mycolicibacterium TaxID=2636767 RepID=UPI0012DEC8AA|nr:MULTISPECIES: phage major capsid protein [unclassified Mycolicibacterium]MUL80509.1 phage major capsid protein [Mycolicibacterium sp. CBMA 329]MUL86276.1 phage major capsid protein [Mycolicibacterium sp. CBMA 331]MUM01062.1 phage major capsid protein [Mycolicibacterium sp. CBMA 334]MUM24956.1 phage major capsid protein [Mycolicibacterium sp. CBMA 295]MUM36572.1 phage major capsid protein [Mycolicibacterium sp. CBMA 247]
MAVLNSNLQAAWTPEDYGNLIDTVVAEVSVAFRAGTIVSTGSETFRVPLYTADPTAAWYAEHSTIALTDPTTNELVITPKKVADRTQISTEAAEDSNPDVANMVATGLARSIAKKIDAAFLGNTVTNGPSGLLSLVGINEIDTDTYPFTNLDAFHHAKADALADGAKVSVWLVAPDVALALSTTKELTTGSNKGLLDANGVADGTLLAGVPVIVSPDVTAGTVWGIDSSQVVVVQRTGTTLKRSFDAAFAEDAVQVRATARISWGFANPAGVVRIYDTA